MHAWVLGLLAHAVAVPAVPVALPLARDGLVEADLIAEEGVLEAVAVVAEAVIIAEHTTGANVN